MRCKVTLVAVVLLIASSLIAVESASAQSTPTPVAPEFTLKLGDYSYDVPTTYSIDPYTGQNVTHAGYRVENRTIELWIKNQLFTPNSDYSFSYNVRVKGHFGEEWREIYHPSDGLPKHSKDEYTVLLFSSKT